MKAREEDSDGFSVGIGALLDGKVKDLGEGFTADAPAPAGETTVRFRTRSRWAFVLVASSTF